MKIRNRWIGVPDNIDAVFTWNNRKVYFFKGKHYDRNVLWAILVPGLSVAFSKKRRKNKGRVKLDHGLPFLAKLDHGLPFLAKLDHGLPFLAK